MVLGLLNVRPKVVSHLATFLFMMAMGMMMGMFLMTSKDIRDKMFG
jgi:hypothetical protein